MTARSKSHVRDQMKLFLAGLSASDRHARSLAACDNLAGTREFKRASTIMMFLSMKDEIETCTLAIRAWQEGKAVVVPRIHWSTTRMDPIQITSLETDVKESALGFAEPIAGLPVPLGIIDMVIIPGLAFDGKGYRVGRGKGFYDRFLSQQDIKAVHCGLCFHEQLIAAPLPCESHDVPMHLIVTDREVLRCPAPSKPAHAPA